ncbi:phosphoribosylglycinamide formyltransferase [Haemophilus haemolyticus]|uniref:Phosphoribosylglycinamide formyltransferase n=1 Tax=Haemophilus haemolyticus TaxID=726 RepID=A0A502LPC6_HAEHA|nr:phosphoribosylglycinamide formyltransferase [Haemophilus haemolyticus]
MFRKNDVNSHRSLGVLLSRDISVEKVGCAYARLDVKL